MTKPLCKSVCQRYPAQHPRIMLDDGQSISAQYDNSKTAIRHVIANSATINITAMLDMKTSPIRIVSGFDLAVGVSELPPPCKRPSCSHFWTFGCDRSV